MTTVIFVAGWEGTGHHFFDQVFQVTGTPNFELKGSWNQWGMMRSGKPWSPSNTAENTEFLREQASLHPGQVLEIKATTSGSYPNGHGSHDERMRQSPNITLLATAAKAANVDLRVLVTRRSAEETLVATCEHRHDLEACDMQAETLAANMKQLVQQLRGMEPSAYQCVAYGDIEDLGKGLAYTLAYNDKDAEKAVRAAWNGEDHHDASADTPETHKTAEPMLGPLSDLDDVCEAAVQVSPQASLSRDAQIAGISPKAWRIIRHILPQGLVLEAEGRTVAT